MSADGGEPVAGVEVTAVLTPIAVAAPTSGRGRTFTAVTDKQGGFSVLVDRGDYRLSFRPPPLSRLPWVVGWTEAQVDADRTLSTVVLDEPTILAGLALGEADAGQTRTLPGAEIAIYGRLPDGSSARIYSGLAGDDGSFEAVLPKDLTER